MREKEKEKERELEKEKGKAKEKEENPSLPLGSLNNTATTPHHTTQPKLKPKTKRKFEYPLLSKEKNIYRHKKG